MTIPSDTEIMACDAFIKISDAAPSGVLWADEYEQASEYARLTWGGSVARHVHTDAVERLQRSGSYGLPKGGLTDLEFGLNQTQGFWEARERATIE